MKRFKNFLLLSCCIVVLGSLTACGSTRANSSQTTTDTTKKDGTGTMNGATDGSVTNDTTVHDNNNGNVLKDVTDGVTNAVDDTVNGVDRAVDDATRNNTTKTETTTNGTTRNGAGTENPNVQGTEK